MQITLTQFQRIDGLMSDLLRAGPFHECADQAGYVRTRNCLLSACIDAMGKPYVDDFANAIECAATIVALGLLKQLDIVDQEAAQ